MGRCGHSSAVYNGHLVVFGGIYEITKELNDCYIFNFQTKVWTRLCSQEEDLTQSKGSPDFKKTAKRDDSPGATMGGSAKLNSL